MQTRSKTRLFNWCQEILDEFAETDEDRADWERGTRALRELENTA
jgi:hypothetical protein